MFIFYFIHSHVCTTLCRCHRPLSLPIFPFCLLDFISFLNISKLGAAKTVTPIRRQTCTDEMLAASIHGVSFYYTNVNANTKYYTRVDCMRARMCMWCVSIYSNCVYFSFLFLRSSSLPFLFSFFFFLCVCAAPLLYFFNVFRFIPAKYGSRWCVFT